MIIERAVFQADSVYDPVMRQNRLIDGLLQPLPVDALL